MADAAKPTIYMVSDGTCRTCQNIVRAVLVQFSDVDVQLVKKAHVRRPKTVRELIRKAADERAVVFYTLVYDRARTAMQEAAREHLVPVVDLLGPVLSSLYDLFKSTPRAKPGILYKSNKDHFDRIDAVEYTMAHDDGCRPQELAEADVVLVGVSRASKTTTCFYLAYGGVRAANVPLFAEGEPPPELVALDPQRVIGLTMNPARLQSVREARLRGWQMDLSDQYARSEQIARELRAANEQMARYGWRCVDTSYKGIEEIAREVMQLLHEAGVQAAQRERPGA
jgi:regulator of PEP synthase PpsR (kinase-PPPase family)